jgi:Uri superfamily endonuclease
VKGIYVLIIKISKPIHPKVGALGEIAFPAGLYAYVGSAQNSLETRVKRHMRKEKRLFWHVDYLLADEAAEVSEVYCLEGDKTCECQIAQLLFQNSQPIAGFGCSDCHCASHLFCSDSFTFLCSNMNRLNLKSQQ